MIMIFTGHAWNMTFSYYHSLQSVPSDLQEAAKIYRYNWWQRLKWMELPFATTGLVWNSMMSMAGGWFFLMINEAFVLGDKDFRLPGVGSYMSVAASQGNIPAMVWAILAMIAMIIFLDQFLWRPVVVWAQKFRVEESGAQEAMNSWFLNFLRRSHLLERLKQWIGRRRKAFARPVPDSALTAADPPPITSNRPQTAAAARVISIAFFLLLMGILLYGAWRLMEILREVQITHWLTIGTAAFLTLFRVLAATAIGTLWAVPAGLAIGLSPRLSRLLQPVVQVAASFPAPMLFPMVIWVLVTFGIGLGTGSIVLMLLGTQWYILFNVIAGAMAVPSDLREATKSFRMGRWQRFRKLYLPATFPYLVTGWVTAAGGAWNASIVSEYVTFRGEVISARGLGAMVSTAAEQADFPLLAGSVVVMSTMVVLFNRLVWRRCYRLAHERFSLNK